MKEKKYRFSFFILYNGRLIFDCVWVNIVVVDLFESVVFGVIVTYFDSLSSPLDFLCWTEPILLVYNFIFVCSKKC